MGKVTLTDIKHDLEDIKHDVVDLKNGKVDKNTNELVLKAIDVKIDGIIKDLENINGYGRWVVLLILGAVFAAVIRLVLK